MFLSQDFIFSAKSSESMGKLTPRPIAVLRGILQKISSSPSLVKDLHTGSCNERSRISSKMEVIVFSSNKVLVSMPELEKVTNVSWV